MKNKINDDGFVPVKQNPAKNILLDEVELFGVEKEAAWIIKKKDITALEFVNLKRLLGL
jgi:hypothetical protein